MKGRPRRDGAVAQGHGGGRQGGGDPAAQQAKKEGGQDIVAAQVHRDGEGSLVAHPACTVSDMHVCRDAFQQARVVPSTVCYEEVHRWQVGRLPAAGCPRRPV